jgi:subtilisin family serine protease
MTNEGKFPVSKGARIVMVLCALLLALAALQAFSAKPAEGQSPRASEEAPATSSATEMVPGEFLVKFEAGISADERRHVVQAQGGRIFDRNAALGVEAVEFPALRGKADDRAGEAIIRALESNPHVKYAEPNYVYTATYTPNDPSIGNQWAWGKINAYKAWDWSPYPRGSSQTKIAIIDTGVRTDHPDFSALLCPLCLSKFYYPYDFISNDTVPNDEKGHGTAVAGVAGAVMNNARGGTGLCPSCRLMPIRAGSSAGTFTDLNVTKALTYAADRGAQVINLSLGGPAGSTTLKTAVDYAWNKGAFLTCAAGNNGTTAYEYPGAFDHCFAVAATDQNDLRAGFSTYGSWVEAAAPGVGIYTTSRWYPEYEVASGTSVAAPHVAGLAGLLVGKGFSNQGIWNRICNTSDRISGTGSSWSCGRINAERAVDTFHNP